MKTHLSWLCLMLTVCPVVVMLPNLGMMIPAHSATAGYTRCSTYLCIKYIQYCDFVRSLFEEHCLSKSVYLEYNEE